MLEIVSPVNPDTALRERQGPVEKRPYRPPAHCGPPPTERWKRYFETMVGFTQPFFITPCDGRKLR
jgi:hypothetical protein